MKTDRKSRTSRKAPFLTSLALACGLMSGNAGAGFPVTDVGNAFTHIMNQIQAYMNQINTLAQKGQDIAHYTAMLGNLDQMFASLGLTFMDIREKTPQELNQATTERCTSSGGSFSPISFVTEALNLNGDIVAQQKAKCVQIVTLQFMQYNEQVKLLDKAKNSQREIQRLERQKMSAKDPGVINSNLLQVQSIMNQLVLDSQYAETVVKTYEGMIKMVEEDQRQLAKRALNGQSGPLQTMVSTGMLACALEDNCPL